MSIFGKNPKQLISDIKAALLKEQVTDQEELRDVMELRDEINKVESLLAQNRGAMTSEQEKHLEKMLNSLKIDVEKAEIELERSKKAMNEATQHAHNLAQSLVAAGRRK